MSSENIETARSLLEGFTRRDLAPLFERFQAGDPSALGELKPFVDLVDDEIEWDVSDLGMPGLGSFRGPEGVLMFWVRWLEGWGSYSFDVANLEAIGDHVVYDTVVRAEGRIGAVPTEWPHSQDDVHGREARRFPRLPRPRGRSRRRRGSVEPLLN